jgi:hypothetical protein
LFVLTHDGYFAARYGTPTEPRNIEVLPRAAMPILRHVQFAIMMEIYTVVSAAAREGLKKLGVAGAMKGLLGSSKDHRSWS